MQPRRGSFATPGVTWAGISSRGVIGSIPMRLGINRRRRSIESDGSYLGNPSSEIRRPKTRLSVESPANYC